jgi:hypothetical protein
MKLEGGIKMKTREEVEQLKRQWLEDSRHSYNGFYVWKIEENKEFIDYWWELTIFRDRMSRKWRAEDAKLSAKQKEAQDAQQRKLICPLMSGGNPLRFCKAEQCAVFTGQCGLIANQGQ